MSLFDRLKEYKGTVSTRQSKEIAAEILTGKKDTLEEAIDLCVYRLEDKKEKQVRAAAAKIVEIVAEKEPYWVAPRLAELLPALNADEPQTRWMIFRIMGFCAKANPELAIKALFDARDCIREKKPGQLCLVSSADLYLGDLGALSEELTQKVFPFLLDSMDNVILNEHDWIMEACMKLIPYLTEEQKKIVLEFAGDYSDHSRKATIKRVDKLRKLCY